MPEKEPTQYTPKGLEIPVPTRGQIDDALAQVARPVVEHRDDEPGPREAFVPLPGKGALRKIARHLPGSKRKRGTREQ